MIKIDNGVKLGWLINPQQQQIEIYRPDKSTTLLNRPLTLSDEMILPNLTLELNFIWN